MEKYMSCKINAHYRTFNKLANTKGNAERKCIVIDQASQQQLQIGLG